MHANFKVLTYSSCSSKKERENKWSKENTEDKWPQTPQTQRMTQIDRFKKLSEMQIGYLQRKLHLRNVTAKVF